jgi:hypothetical protein
MRGFLAIWRENAGILLQRVGRFEENEIIHTPTQKGVDTLRGIA